MDQILDFADKYSKETISYRYNIHLFKFRYPLSIIFMALFLITLIFGFLKGYVKTVDWIYLKWLAVCMVEEISFLALAESMRQKLDSNIIKNVNEKLHMACKEFNEAAKIKLSRIFGCDPSELYKQAFIIENMLNIYKKNNSDGKFQNSISKIIFEESSKQRMVNYFTILVSIVLTLLLVDKNKPDFVDIWRTFSSKPFLLVYGTVFLLGLVVLLFNAKGGILPGFMNDFIRRFFKKDFKDEKAIQFFISELIKYNTFKEENGMIKLILPR